jgi:soluble lytic murein transglycosylase-like protein
LLSIPDWRRLSALPCYGRYRPTSHGSLSLQDPFDRYTDADGSARLLAQLWQDFGGNLDLVLAGYNAGSDAVNHYHGVPPYRETIDYVKHVGQIYTLCSAGP